MKIAALKAGDIADIGPLFFSLAWSNVCSITPILKSICLMSAYEF
jgi:hypothetical protein